MTAARYLLVCSVLLLFTNGAHAGGVYQRTKDGKTLVWNKDPGRGQEATWSGGRDSNGYATGSGTLTWYKVERKVVTGSNIPTTRKENAVVVSRYSGVMARGKLQAQVANVGAKGKPPAVSTPTPTQTPEPRNKERTQEAPVVSSQEPTPIVEQRRDQRARVGAIVEAPTESTVAFEKTPSPARMPSPAALSSTPAAASSPPTNPAAVEAAVKKRIIADFKDETESVLSRVGQATGNFHEVDRLDSIQKLPAPVSESVSSLTARARDFRSKLGYETALREYRTETETVDALSAVDQITRNIAANDAAEASSKLTGFLKNNPEPNADSQKPLWRYLTSMRSVCSRSEKEAEVHSQRAQSLSAAGRTSEAIREYQEAYRTFPNPATAEKIRQLQDNSLGL